MSKADRLAHVPLRVLVAACAVMLAATLACSDRGPPGAGGNDSGGQGGSAGGGGTGGLGGTGGTGGTGGMGGVGGALTEPRSFSATFTFKTTGPGHADLPEDLELMVRLDPMGRFIVLGTSGYMRAGPLAPASADGTFSITSALIFPLTSRCDGTTLTFSSLALRVLPGNVLEGTAAGQAETLGGDVIDSVTFSATIKGVTDKVPPKPVFTADRSHPFDEILVAFNEPVAASLPVRLRTAGAPDEAFDPYEPQYDTAIRWTHGAIRRFQTTFTVEFGVPVVDLAGNPAIVVPLPPLRTLPDPGFLGDPGFEGTYAAHIDGDVATVDSGTLPPLLGDRSLLYPPGYVPARFTARLPVPPGAKGVRFLARPVGEGTPPGYFNARIAVGAPGHPSVSVPLEIEPSDPVESIGMYMLRPLQTIDVPLPPGTTAEVDFDIVRRWGCGLVPPSAGLLIDDLRAY